MKRILISIAAIAALCGCNNHKYDLKPTKLYWRNTPWSTHISDTSFFGSDKEAGLITTNTDFVLLREEAHASTYKRKSEKLCIGVACLDSVRYKFFNNELMSVTVYPELDSNGLPYHGVSPISKVVAYFKEEFGTFNNPSGYVDQIYEDRESKFPIPMDYHYYIIVSPAMIEYVNSDAKIKYKKYLTDIQEKETSKQEKVVESVIRKELNSCPLH